MNAKKQGLDDDYDVRSALDWLAVASGDPGQFWTRLTKAQDWYRIVTSNPNNLGQDPNLASFSNDLVGAFFAQSKSLLDDRRSYDFSLGSLTVPWVKQLGRNIGAIDQVQGARERASRMLRSSPTDPGSAMLELVMASNYAADGSRVAFVNELKGRAKTPDLHLHVEDSEYVIPIELKRLQRGKYELEEARRHGLIFRAVAEIVDRQQASIHIDVTYTRELADVPVSYLADRLIHAQSSPIVTLRSYPWRDEFGFGEIGPANLDAVKQDIHDSSLYFGTKLARLLSGNAVREHGYHLAAGATPDARDPRYIQEIHYGSVVTWQCTAQQAIERKARYVTAKLVEADRQLSGHGLGIVHVAMDAELQCESSDLRRARNFEAIRGFRSESIVALYVHYLVPRISEAHSWLVDETVDSFGAGSEPVPTLKIFSESTPMENDLPAWRQHVPIPRR